MMKRVVYKYKINMSVDEFVVVMPRSAGIVKVEKQHEQPMFWALCDEGDFTADRRFTVKGTGHPVEPNMTYMGTWLDGEFVWHLFEVNR